MSFWLSGRGAIRTYELIVVVDDDEIITVVTIEVKVVDVAEDTVRTGGVAVATTVVVVSVLVGVIVVFAMMVDVDVEPGASQLQKLLTRLVAILRTLARREVQSIVVAARLTLMTNVEVAGRVVVRTRLEVSKVASVVVVETSK